jgi:hypothetical protein
MDPVEALHPSIHADTDTHATTWKARAHIRQAAEHHMEPSSCWTRSIAQELDRVRSVIGGPAEMGPMCA